MRPGTRWVVEAAGGRTQYRRRHEAATAAVRAARAGGAVALWEGERLHAAVGEDFRGCPWCWFRVKHATRRER